MFDINHREKYIEIIFLLCAVSSIVILFLIFAAVTYIGSPVIINWILNGCGLDWSSNFGPIRLTFATIYVGLGATIGASIVGIPCGIYLAEFADRKIRNIIKPSLEILTGFPSVVMGIIGAVLIVGMISITFETREPAYGIMAAWILLAIMSLPHVASISEDSMRAVPKELREASLALGATNWQTTTKVVIPHAKSGILTAIILGMGNAIGETMAVIFVIGLYTQPSLNPLDIFSRTNVIPAFIASSNIRGSESGDTDLSGIFAAGFILFLIIFVFNLVIRRTLKGSGKSRGS